MATISPLHYEMGIPLLPRAGGFHDLVHPTVHSGSVADALVAYHEASHDRMFRITRFGFAQLMFKVLAERRGIPEDLRSAAKSANSALYGASVLVHEIAATYLSLRALPRSMYDELLENLPSAYRGFHDRLENVLGAGYPSHHVQFTIGLITCRLALGVPVFETIAAWQPGQDLVLPHDLTPDLIFDEVIDRFPPKPDIFRSEYERQLERQGLAQQWKGFDYNDEGAWGALPVSSAEQIESVIERSCEQFARDDSRLRSLIWDPGDRRKAELVVSTFNRLSPDFIPPFHEALFYGNAVEPDSFEAAILNFLHRGLANIRVSNAEAVDTHAWPIVDTSLGLGASPQPFHQYLISENREAGIDLPWLHFRMKPDNPNAPECCRVSRDAVRRYFQQRMLITQLGAPVPANVTAIVGVTYETYASLRAEHDFIIDLHRFLGGGTGSVAPSAVKFYMSGDLYQWLYAFSKRGTIGLATFYPQQFGQHTQKYADLAERASNGDATSDELEQERSEFLRAEFASELFGIFVKLEKSGPVYFRFSPMWAGASIMNAVAPLLKDGKAELLDRPTMVALAGEVGLLQGMLRLVWPTL
jgi:hypothetical protein